MRSLSLLLALSGAVSALPFQQHQHRRVQARNVVDGIEWHTVTEYAMTTVDVYTTVYVNPEDMPAPTLTPTPSPPVNVAPSPPVVPEPAPSSSGLQALQIPQNTPTPPPAPPTPTPSPSVAAPVVVPPAPVASAPPQQQEEQGQGPSGSTEGGGSGGGGITPSIFSTFSNPLPGASAPYACPGGCVGEMTFFNPSVGMGACGPKPDGSIWTDAEDVVAISVKMMGSLSSGDVMNPFCGRRVRIENPNNGRTAEGLVVDKCAGCAGDADIDLSPALYDQLADQAEGRIEGVKWSWIE